MEAKKTRNQIVTFFWGRSFQREEFSEREGRHQNREIFWESVGDLEKLWEGKAGRAETEERKGTFSGTFARPHFDCH